MVQRPGGDSVSAKGWWTRSYMPCSQLWAGRTQTIRWVGQVGTSSQFSLQVLKTQWSQEQDPKLGNSLEWHRWEQVGTTQSRGHSLSWQLPPA